LWWAIANDFAHNRERRLSTFPTLSFWTLTELMGRLESGMSFSLMRERKKILRRVFKRDLIARLLERARLTRLERTVIEGFAQGDNHAEIARELGVSRQRVKQALKSAISKLRNAAIELGELQPSMPSKFKRELVSLNRRECNEYAFGKVFR
jgi:DNA-binding CsgD family transcriptional regulator